MTIENDARAEAYRRYTGDRIISEVTGEYETFDDWGYAECERAAFIAGYLAGAQRAALDMPAATRVEVIDPHEGRAFTAYYDAPGVIVRVQDEGRTVKLFTSGKRAANVGEPLRDFHFAGANEGAAAFTEGMIERAAEALDKNYNPDRYPVMAAMFQDYARTALEAALTEKEQA